MTPLEDLVGDVFRALDARDYGRVEELLAPDCEVVVPGFRGRGAQAFIAWTQPFLDAFPDLEHDVGPVVEDGARVALELRVRGTHTAPMRTPAGELPPTQRPLDLAAANIWQTEGGRIVAYHVYFDQMEFLGQLGLLPEPAPTG